MARRRSSACVALINIRFMCVFLVANNAQLSRPPEPLRRGRSLTPWPAFQASAVSRALAANEEGIAGERGTVRRWWHTGAATLTRTGRRRVEVGETSKRAVIGVDADSSALSLGSLGSSTSPLLQSGRLGYSVF